MNFLMASPRSPWPGSSPILSTGWALLGRESGAKPLKDFPRVAKPVSLGRHGLLAGVGSARQATGQGPVPGPGAHRKWNGTPGHRATTGLPLLSWQGGPSSAAQGGWYGAGGAQWEVPGGFLAPLNGHTPIKAGAIRGPS